MSMKDAIFGTAAPTSHGGATYRDSIQAWLPVKNIIGGVVITKDNRFIKILEVLPVNFYLKSPADQQNIILRCVSENCAGQHELRGAHTPAGYERIRRADAAVPENRGK